MLLGTHPSRSFLAVAAFALTACGENAFPSGLPIGISDDDAEAALQCTGTLTGARDTDVVVPRDASCTLQGAIVRGDVQALEGARLHIFDSLITGSVEADDAAIVQIVGGTVEGDIRIFDGIAPGEIGAVVDGTIVSFGNVLIEGVRTARVQVTNTEVRRGGVRVADNVVEARLDVVGNGVAGILEVFRNGGTGEKLVRDNRALDVDCEQNAPPFTGGPNRADGARAQCF